MKRAPYVTGFGLLLLASASASAAEGYVTRSVSLRAGPDSSYPRVARLHSGEAVTIEGCVDGWSWCDVTSRDDRGWVNGHYLQQEYQGHRVLVPAYGVRIGIPVISFVFGSYWDNHYRHRSWYGNRTRWSHVRPHYSSTYNHGAAAPDSHNRSYSTTNADTHQSNTTVYRAPRSSSQPANVAPTPSSRQAPARATDLPEARRARTVENGSGHTTQVLRDAPQNAASRHEAVQSGAEHNASPASSSRHGDHGDKPPRAVPEHSAGADRPAQQSPHAEEQHAVSAQHEARAPNAAPRAANENPAHDQNRNHERGNGKATSKDKDKGKDDDKDGGGRNKEQN